MSEERNVQVYREDGGAWLVEVLKDETTDNMRHVTLRCLKQIRSSPLIREIETGEEWDASIATNCCFGGMWTLSDPQPGDAVL